MRAPGEKFGEYVLVRRIGQRATDRVWLAKERETGAMRVLDIIALEEISQKTRPVAFELLAGALARFGRLDHPGLVRVFGTARSEADDAFALVSEYIEGQSADRIALARASDGDTPLEGQTLIGLLGIVEQLSAILVWLHRQGIVHGSVKCANVMLEIGRMEPKVRLLDLVWSRAGFGRLLRGPRREGAPEQVSGAAPSFASDQWAIAKLTSDLIVGATDDASPTRALTRAPLALLRVLRRALEDDPERRFRDVETFSRALLAVRNDLAAQMPAPSTSAGTMQLAASEIEAKRRGESLRSVANDPTEIVPSLAHAKRSRDARVIEDSGPYRDLTLPPARVEPKRVAAIGVMIACGVIIVVATIASIASILSRDELASTDAAGTRTIARPFATAQVDVRVDDAGATTAKIEDAEAHVELPPANVLPSGRAAERDGVAELDAACKAGRLASCMAAARRYEDMHERQERARVLYERACDGAIAEACARLALLWQRGVGGPSSARTSAALASRACRLGHGPSCR